jgi:hypothetical protein
MADRNVILQAEYEADVMDLERSLGWLVPEPSDAGWTLTEDTPDVRKWAGVIVGDTNPGPVERGLPFVWQG